MDNDTEQRIKQESAKVKVASYQKVASLGGWSGGGRTLWAISALGAVTGAAIGAVAPLFPMIVGAALPALPVIGASAAIFAATGLTMGFSGGLVLGRISGSAAAVGHEAEKRMKEWMVRQKITDNPQAEIAPDAPNEPATPKTFFQKVREKYYRYVNPRVGLFFAAVGAIGGLVLGAAFLASGGATGIVMGATPLLQTLTGITTLGADLAATGAALASAQATVLAYSAGVCAAFGALFGVHYPRITSEITEVAGKLLSGKPLGREWETPEDLAKQNGLDHPRDMYNTLNGATAKKYTDQFPSRDAGSFQEMVAQSKSAVEPAVNR